MQELSCPGALCKLDSVPNAALDVEDQLDLDKIEMACRGLARPIDRTRVFNKDGWEDAAAGERGDFHFDPRIGIAGDVDIGIELGLRPAPNILYRRARNSMLANLNEAIRHDVDRVAYSRSSGYYAKREQMRAPKFMTYGRMMKVVNEIATQGLCANHVPKPSPTQQWRSTLRPTDKLIKFALNFPIKLSFDVGFPIVLRDENKRPTAVPDNRRVRSMHADITAQNEFISKAVIEFNHPGWRIDTNGYFAKELPSGGCLIFNPSARNLTRIFNQTLMRGGRFYRAFWIGMPSDDRMHIVINGNETVERDHEHLHPTLLSAAQGHEWSSPSGNDPYVISEVVEFLATFGLNPKQARTVVKRAFNIGINASKEKAAIGALADKLREKKMQAELRCFLSKSDAHRLSKFVFGRVKAHLGHLTPFLFSGAGAVLQNIDADMAAMVMRELRKQHIVCLPVHDSFIVEKQHERALTQAMDQALTWGKDQARKRRFDFVANPSSAGLQ